MSILGGTIPGSSSRIGGGIGSLAGVMVTDMNYAAYQTYQTIRPALGMKDSVGISRFRRHLNGLTTDATNAALPGASLDVYENATKLLMGSLVSDAAGNYDLPVYKDGPYYIWADKAGSPEVFGASGLINPT